MCNCCLSFLPLKPRLPSFLHGKVFNYRLGLLIGPALLTWATCVSLRLLLGLPGGSHPPLRMSLESLHGWAAWKLPPGHQRGTWPAHLFCVPFCGHRGSSSPHIQHLENPSFICFACVSLFLVGKVNPGPVVPLGWKRRSTIWFSLLESNTCFLEQI